MTARSIIAALLLVACAAEPPRTPGPGEGIKTPSANDPAEQQCRSECDDELDACLEHEQGSSAPCGLACAQRCAAFYDACDADCD